MTTAPEENWVSCPAPDVSDIIRWREPIWDKPNKPRGKRDKIGEQLVTAKVITTGEPAELQVITVKCLSLAGGKKDEPSKIRENDMIRRKMSSIKNGECQKLLEEI